MNIRRSFEPCLCGAPDCPRCFPENFKNGRYIGDDEDNDECNDDDGGYEPDYDDGDEDADWGGMEDGYGEPAE